MIAQNVTAKAYEEKVSAQLQQAEAQLAEFEARAKGKMGRRRLTPLTN